MHPQDPIQGNSMGFPRSDPFKGEQIRRGATTEKRCDDGWSQYGVSFPPPITCPPSSLSKSPMRGRPSVYPQDPIHGNSMGFPRSDPFKGEQIRQGATTEKRRYDGWSQYGVSFLPPHYLPPIFPVEVANARPTLRASPRPDPWKLHEERCYDRQGATTEERCYDGLSLYGVSFPPPITCAPSSLSKSPMRARNLGVLDHIAELGGAL